MTRRDGTDRIECQVPTSAWRSGRTPVPAFTGGCGSGDRGATSPAPARWGLGPTGPAPVDPSLSMATPGFLTMPRVLSARSPAADSQPLRRRPTSAWNVPRGRGKATTSSVWHPLRSSANAAAPAGDVRPRTPSERCCTAGPEAIFPQWAPSAGAGCCARRAIGSTTVRTGPPDTADGTDGGACLCNLARARFRPTSRAVSPLRPTYEDPQNRRPGLLSTWQSS